MRRFKSSIFQVFSVLTLMMLAFSPASAGVFELDSRGEARTMKAKVQAAQFLQRGTFGPKMADIDALANRIGQIGVRRACEEWIDNQFALPASNHQQRAIDMIAADGFNTLGEPDVWIQRYRHHAWWDIAIRSPDQLRQRMAWALSQIVVTSSEGDGFDDRGPGNISGLGRWLGPGNYYDMLARNAFGNYRTLLTDVTYHPIMGVYLSHMKNRKSDGTRSPDENFAREVMQLFSIGLYELQQDGRLTKTLTGELIPTYDNDKIKEFARAFTGLSFKPNPNNNGNAFYSGNDFLYAMEMYQPEHDTAPKTLLNGQVVDIDAGNADIAAALDNIFAHNNVAPFISYRLIQRLVKSNPSRAYIRRVARKFEDNGSGVKGDLKAVVKAILLDPEAWRSMMVRTMRNPDRVEVIPRGTEYSRLREPVIRYTSLLRGLGAVSDYHNSNIASEKWMMVLPQDYNWTQEPYRSPSVFNFYLPSYQPPGELIAFQPSRQIPNGNLVAPEFQQQTAVTSNRLMNRYIWDLSRGSALYTASNPNYSFSCTLTFDLVADRALVNTINLTNKGSLSDAAWMAIQRSEAAQSVLPSLIDKYDLLFCCGTMPQDYKDEMAYVVLKETDWMIGNTGISDNGQMWRDRAGEFRVLTSLICILTSPFAAIEE